MSERDDEELSAKLRRLRRTVAEQRAKLQRLLDQDGLVTKQAGWRVTQRRELVRRRWALAGDHTIH